MSDIILPNGAPSDRGVFVQGRRLKRVTSLEDFFGCVIVLRSPCEESKGVVPAMKRTGGVGLLQTLTTDPLDPKRAKEIYVLSPARPGAFIPIPVQILEASDPWAFPPGLPDQAVSMLE